MLAAQVAVGIQVRRAGWITSMARPFNYSDHFGWPVVCCVLYHDHTANANFTWEERTWFYPDYWGMAVDVLVACMLVMCTRRTLVRIASMRYPFQFSLGTLLQLVLVIAIVIAFVFSANKRIRDRRIESLTPEWNNRMSLIAVWPLSIGVAAVSMEAGQLLMTCFRRIERTVVPTEKNLRGTSTGPHEREGPKRGEP